jgi:hypothetical protein
VDLGAYSQGQLASVRSYPPARCVPYLSSKHRALTNRQHSRAPYVPSQAVFQPQTSSSLIDHSVKLTNALQGGHLNHFDRGVLLLSDPACKPIITVDGISEVQCHGCGMVYCLPFSASARRGDGGVGHIFKWIDHRAMCGGLESVRVR